jgi:hypothetical protein
VLSAHPDVGVCSAPMTFEFEEFCLGHARPVLTCSYLPTDTARLSAFRACLAGRGMKSAEGPMRRIPIDAPLPESEVDR